MQKTACMRRHDCERHLMLFDGNTTKRLGMFS